MIYRKDIDGLRAIAVMAVVLFHFGFSSLSGGFVGVDVFFVISGYLITEKIHADVRKGQFSFGTFLQRRLRRLMPAAIVMLAVTTAFASWLFLPEVLADFGRSLRATTAFISNLFFMDEVGYFAGSALTQPLLHTWSLAVEEQFYLLFPLLLVFVLKRSAHRLVLVIYGLILLSLALSIYGVERKPMYAFYWPLTRAWEFGIGALVALQAWPNLSQKHRLREALSLVGLVMIIVPVLIYDEQTAFPGINSIMPCVGAALVIYSGQQGPTWLARLLAVKPMVAIGLISYSLYLWHWPLVVFSEYYLMAESSLVLTLGLLISCLLLGWLSWRFVEQPVRLRQRLRSDRTLVGAVAFGLIILFAVGNILTVRQGFPERFPELADQLTVWSTNHHKDFEHCDASRDRCSVNESQDPAQYLLWGDSHAQAMVEALSGQADRFGHAVQYQVKNGCPPLPDTEVGSKRFSRECSQRNQQVMDYLRTNAAIKDVVLAARWSSYVEGPSTRLGSAEKGNRADYIGGNTAELTAVARGQLLQERLLHLVQQLQAAGKRVTLVYPVPETGFDIPTVTARAQRFDRDLETAPSFRAYLQRQQRVLPALDAVRQQSGALAVYPARKLCDEVRCITHLDGAPIYFDDDHLNQLGERLISPAFAPLFQRSGSEITGKTVISGEGV